MSAVLQNEGVVSVNGYGAGRSWLASINLEYQDRRGKSVLTDMAFEGPLRVQRPFYPEGGRCHTYLLHPPGGMVSGDKITITASVFDGAKALITTPSAGKVYGADSDKVAQEQSVNLFVSSDSELEWLPQETIVFNGAKAHLKTHIEVARSAKLFAWDIVSFGRPHGEHWFTEGSVHQTITLNIDGEPVLEERFATDHELEILKSPVGLMGNSHMATFLIVSPQDEGRYEQWRDLVRDYLETSAHAADSDSDSESVDAVLIAVTAKPKILVVRALSNDIELLRNKFIELWQLLRPEVLSEQGAVPRIWNT
jgi:urease accessory protein